ncbi:peptidoglycan/xylan/chitin deacetylase (PgdA/CDA1 family) [Anaerotaenia torta]|uniref:polysaccharide deacetylase family protein n=1 Tax=Anaerotaenia torta TaxID=433293 RepID=UPI003D1C0C07
MNKTPLYRKAIVILLFILLSISIIKDSVELYIKSSANSRSIYVPIVMYHRVMNTELGKNTITPYEFECDLKYLKENHYNTITMSQLIDYVYEGAELPSNPIILSFDDAPIDTYKNVFPLLKKYNMKIVLSIIGKSTEDFTRVGGSNADYAHMTFSQIKEMADSGLAEIQNHTYNLHAIKNGRYGCGQMKNESLSSYEELLTADVCSFQDIVCRELNITPTTFAYPYGKYNNNSENILRKLGFKATLTCTYGVNIITNDPECLYELKRIGRSHNDGIAKLIQDAMLTLKYNKELN